MFDYNNSKKQTLMCLYHNQEIMSLKLYENMHDFIQLGHSRTSAPRVVCCPTESLLIQQSNSRGPVTKLTKFTLQPEKTSSSKTCNILNPNLKIKS